MSASALPWIEWVTTGGLGAAMMKGFDFVAARGQSKAYTMGAVDHAVSTAMELVTTRLEKVEGQHEQCETTLETVRSDLSEAKDEIARLMRGEVPAYEMKAANND